MPSFVRKPFFYDAQFKRILLQIMSCFAGYQVQTGTQRNGKPLFRDVPIIYGNMSRTAAYILTNQGNQANTTNYIPIMALYMTNLAMDASRRLNPQHYELFRFRERIRDAEGNLTEEASPEIIAERYMPVPYEMKVDLTIWTSNDNETHQLLEQILTVFNPQIEIELSNSPADWSFVTSLFLENIDISAAKPAGEDTDSFYTSTLGFRTNILLSPPVKVYESKPIYEIQVPIHQLEDNFDFDESVPIETLIIGIDDIETEESGGNQQGQE